MVTKFAAHIFLTSLTSLSILLTSSLSHSALIIKDEGIKQGSVSFIDCVGDALACTKSGVTGTFTSTGVASGSSPTFTDLTLSGANILANATASGQLTLGSTGGSNNELITYDFDTTADIVEVTTSTGAQIYYNGVIVRTADDTLLVWGNGFDVKSQWDTSQTNDSLQVGLELGSTERSGYMSIMQEDDLSHANRDPATFSSDPVLRVFSADETQADDFIEIYHNQSDARVVSGQGNLNLRTPSTLTLTSNNGHTQSEIVSGETAYAKYFNITFDQLLLGVHDNVGNQYILTNYNNRNVDHDHGVQTNPKLFVHSDKSPDTDNTEWIGMQHNQFNAVLDNGSGAFIIDSAGDVRFDVGNNADPVYFQEAGVSGLNIVTDLTDDEARMGVWDNSGNLLVITNNSNASRDHDHAAQTNPTLYIHSDTNPDTANDEWVGITHDVTNAVVTVGSGDIVLTGEVQITDTNTGGNAGTDLCLGADNTICVCTTCA